MVDVRSSLLASLLRRLLATPATAVGVTDPAGAADIALRGDDETITVSVRGEVTMTVCEWRNLRSAVPGLTVDSALALTAG